MSTWSAVRRRRSGTAARVFAPVVAAAFILPALASAPQPDFSGSWILDRQRSDDARARIAEAAGPAHVKGGGTNPLTILPPMGMKGSVERVELRDWLMSMVEHLERLDIEQRADEIKLFNGEDVARTFYLGREHVRQDGQGRKLKCNARWNGAQLMLDEQGDKGRRLRETLTLEPGSGVLVHELHMEDKLLKKPLELRLLYVKQDAAAPPP